MTAMTLRTTTALSLVGLFGIAFAAGCGGEPDVDLNTLAIADEGGKADSLGTDVGDYSWTRAIPGFVQCIKAPCPSTKLYAVNTGEQRFIYRIDWRALKLTQTETEDAEAKAGSMLMYGRFVTARALGENVLVYQVTRANLPAADRAGDKFDADKYYWPSATKECIANPQCTTLQSGLLNKRNQTETWSNLDLLRLELTPAAEKTLFAELKEGKNYVSVIGVQGGVARATQVFRPFKAPPLK